MTLAKRGLSSIGGFPAITIYGAGDGELEHGEIEELHYLMVRVEKMKKTMLAKVELKEELAGGEVNVKKNPDEALYSNADLFNMSS